MSPEPTAAQQLRQRLRKYFLVVFGLISGLFVTIVLVAAGLKILGADQKTSGTVLGILGPLLMLGVVVTSGVAVSRLWRCPKCERGLYWMVSWNMSVFASRVSPDCPGCGVRLFERDRQKRRVRFILIAVLLMAAMGFGSSMFFASKRARGPAPANVKPP